MSNRPRAVILDFASLGAAIRERNATLGRPPEQARPLGWEPEIAELAERTNNAMERLGRLPSDSE